MRTKIKKFVKKQNISILKTVLLNFKCLPFNQAIHFPIFVYSNTILKSMGNIRINAPLSKGMICIGKENFFSGGRTVIQNSGEIIFNGKAQLMSGSSICNMGKITFGEFTLIGEGVKILIMDKLQVGNHTRIGFDSVILDTDFHTTINTLTHEVSKSVFPVEIGNWNWIGHNCTIHKGVKTADFSIVASNSFLNKDYSNSVEPLLAGSPAKIVRNNIRRIYNPDTNKYISVFFDENPGVLSFKAEIGDNMEDFILKGFEM